LKLAPGVVLFAKTVFKPKVTTYVFVPWWTVQQQTATDLVEINGTLLCWAAGGGGHWAVCTDLMKRLEKKRCDTEDDDDIC
jgi:hypothetical protein